MTEPEARTAKISEVWAEFSKQCGLRSNCEHIVKIHSGKNDQTVRDNLEKAIVYWAMLRAVLLERCGQIWDADGVDTQITIFKTPSMDCIRVDQGKYVRYDDYETCLNMSAAYAFWAWELKQRQNESNGR